MDRCLYFWPLNIGNPTWHEHSAAHSRSLKASNLLGRVLMSQKSIRPYHFGKKRLAPSYGLYLNDTIGFSDRVISQNLAHENSAMGHQLFTRIARLVMRSVMEKSTFEKHELVTNLSRTCNELSTSSSFKKSTSKNLNTK